MRTAAGGRRGGGYRRNGGGPLTDARSAARRGGRSNTQRFKVDIAGLKPRPNSALNLENPNPSAAIWVRNGELAGLSSGGMSKTQSRELGRAVVDGAKIAVLPPGRKPGPRAGVRALLGFGVQDLDAAPVPTRSPHPEPDAGAVCRGSRHRRVFRPDPVRAGRPPRKLTGGPSGRQPTCLGLNVTADLRLFSE